MQINSTITHPYNNQNTINYKTKKQQIHTIHTHYKYIYKYIYAKKKKPNENWTVKHNLQDLRFIEKSIWKASIQKKKKTPKNPKKKKLTIIANKFNNYSSIQQSKHYKLQHKTTRKYTPKIA